jgi:hypothetical protein
VGSQRIDIPSSLIVPIISDAAIAGPVADGRLIPLLVLDATGRSELVELIRVHAHLQHPGDVASTWAESKGNSDSILLLLEFSAPIELKLALQFSIERQAILVEGVVTSGAVYLQTGSASDDLETKLDAPRILVEVPDMGFGPVWDRLLQKRMTAVLRRVMGVSRKRARDAAASMIAEMRSLVGLRMQAREKVDGTDASDL